MLYLGNHLTYDLDLGTKIFPCQKYLHEIFCLKLIAATILEISQLFCDGGPAGTACPVAVS